METTKHVTIVTEFLRDGAVVHSHTLGTDFIDMTMKHLKRNFGAKGVWTTRSRTITTTVEYGEWE